MELTAGASTCSGSVPGHGAVGMDTTVEATLEATG